MMKMVAPTWRRFALVVFAGYALCSTVTWISQTTEEASNDESSSVDLPNPRMSSVSSYNSYSRVSLSPEAPLLDLSLPNSASVALHRFFKCSASSSGGPWEMSDIGRHWTRSNVTDTQRVPIGLCIKANVQHPGTLLTQRRPLDTCGDFSIWTDLPYMRPPKRNKQNSKSGSCYYVSMQHAALEAMHDAYPKATIMQVIRDPTKWYQTLSRDLQRQWPQWCNINHRCPSFPQDNDDGDALAKEQQWKKFYQEHVDHIRQFVQRHPSWKYIEVDLDSSQKRPAATAQQLWELLGAPKHCWTDAIAPPNAARPGGKDQSHGIRPKINDVTYPVLVTSLPKSGTSTTHSFFECGLGPKRSDHHWTRNTTTQQQIQIGKCMDTNLGQNRPLMQDCGHARVWSDTGVVIYSPGNLPEDAVEPYCFYPTLHGNALGAFYKSHPYGTLLHVVRNATEWIDSCRAWGNLHLRWAASKCDGFPPLNATVSMWEDFYHKHTEFVRAFAKEHPTLTYVEVDLEDPNTSANLADAFGFSEQCWGHVHPNAGKPAALKRANTKVREGPAAIRRGEFRRIQGPANE